LLRLEKFSQPGITDESLLFGILASLVTILVLLVLQALMTLAATRAVAKKNRGEDSRYPLVGRW
jgi:uncharacterized Tic20 family protein